MRKEVLFGVLISVIMLLLAMAGCSKERALPAESASVDDVSDDSSESAADDEQALDEEPTSTSTVNVPAKYQLKGDESISEYSVKVDDSSFSPWDIIVNNDDAVVLTFIFDDAKSKYDGYDIRSEYFQVTHMKGDKNQVIVEFVPHGNVEYELYPHGSDSRKAIGKMTLE